jgi:NAD(P)-dependent dehydrogenase (short-subunit alcohol dehydrogenase family)
MSLLEQRANLHGRTAAVIGGAGGIGRAVTVALAQAGVDVAFCDVDAEAIGPTRTAVEACGRRVLATTTDALDLGQLEDFYAAVGSAFPQLDIVVNVVGGVLMQPFTEKSRESCLQDMHRNYGYVLDSMRCAIPLVRRGGRGGSIVNFTTIEAHRGAGGFAVYAGAKAATTCFSRAMAWELGPEGIRVNLIAPDTTPSAGNENALPEALRAGGAEVPADWWSQSFGMYIPLQRPPSPDDLANAVLFLCSDLARSITGQVLHVDGGTSAALGMIRWPHDGGVTLPVPLAGTMRRLFG